MSQSHIGLTVTWERLAVSTAWVGTLGISTKRIDVFPITLRTMHVIPKLEILAPSLLMVLNTAILALLGDHIRIIFWAKGTSKSHAV